jgi:hypothetical protein
VLIETAQGFIYPNYQVEAGARGVIIYPKTTVLYVRYRVSLVSAIETPSFLPLQLMSIMFPMKGQIVFLLLLEFVWSATVTYTIPASAPTTATALDPAPLGIS